MNFSLTEETDGYVTLDDPANTSSKYLIAGSKNCMIDANRKVLSRPGYTRLGAANANLFNNKNGWTWNTSSGTKLPQRNNNTNLDVYLATVDTMAINAWQTITSIFSATKKLRPASRDGGGFFDATENIDVQPMVNGDSSIYEWNGAVAVVASASNSGSSSGIQLRGNSASLTSFSMSYSDLTSPPVTTYQNNLTGTSLSALINILQTVIDGDVLTLTINGIAVTIQFVAVIGATAGNVLIGAGPGVTLTNLLGLLNNPSTTTANHVAFSAPNQARIAFLTATTAGSITKAGTTTFGQNRFYSTRNTVMRCLRTGVTYAYDGIVGTTTVTVAGSTTGLIAGDILVQEIVTTLTKPSSSPYTNDVIFSFENQIVIGSLNSEVYYVSKNTSYTDFSFSSPRATGEGFQLTLTDPVRAINGLGEKLLIFCGASTIFKVEFSQITVGTTIAETVKAKKLDVGVNQGALNHESVVQLGNAIAYLTNEVAVRVIENPEDLTGIDPKTFSNPIKPDFDAETWDVDNTFGTWYKNILIFTAGATSHMYMLNFVADANGKVSRFWNPPQILPFGPMSLIDSGNGAKLHGHSNSVPETYLAFDGISDGQYADMDVSDKLPIDVNIAYAYDSYGGKNGSNAAVLKTFDEYFVEGEIIPSSIAVLLTLKYDYEGETQVVNKIINGSDETILEGLVGNNSLAQESLGVDTLGGLLNPPSTARKFHVVFELPREDFFRLNPSFSVNDVDQYFAVNRHGANVSLSRRRATQIRK